MCTGCAFAGDGARLAVTTREGRLVELDVRVLEVLTSRALPSAPLTVTYLPKPGPEGAGEGAQGEEMWLVACKDGGVYGYELEGEGDAPLTALRPPYGPDVAALVVSVAAGGAAVAVGGEPQEASLLPRMQPTRAHARPTAAAPSTSTSAPAAAGSAAAAGASTSTSAAAAATVGHTEPRAAAVAAAAHAPAARRRGPGGGGGGGGGAGRWVAGGLGARDPLALFDEVEAAEAEAGSSGADKVARGVAAMSLGSGPGGAPGASAGPAGASLGPQGGADTAMGGTEEEGEGEEEAAERRRATETVPGGHGEGHGPGHGQGDGGHGVRMRAPLYVYRVPAW
ncbi:hypothetical protein HYH03_013264 [Edaphochlamys debaryana]|uniref:Uncharacterized protein n=1 Tax=Edaphochlamys debaryana TaxID=47281 RepID=A0A835XQB0_9CHLO|nr:hypothetical protein HYH03_013264 [Edaphochlamys debaryana]|eukprot:KAG2488116.1 hypothetical protein HYH03_013264 [Edaphochlamys debaryana]